MLNHRKQRFFISKTARFNRGVDSVLTAFPKQLGSKFGLKERLAAGNCYTASRRFVKHLISFDLIVDLIGRNAFPVDLQCFGRAYLRAGATADT